LSMISTKADLKRFLNSDMQFYYCMSKKNRFMCWLTGDPAYVIAKYLRALRKEEYYHNVRQDKLGRVMEICWLRKKNLLGNRLGFKIPRNCFGSGLTIYHHGEIIVNEAARVGNDCKLHGGNCIGNKGSEDVAPIIGDGFDMGIGAKVIGDVKLGNRVKVGANAVVTKSFEADDIVLIGIPASAK